MAGVNLAEVYLSGFSITELSERFGIPKSTIRFRLKKAGVLRTHNEAMKLASAKGRFASVWKGKPHPHNAVWNKHISEAKLKKADLTAKGFTVKKSGYVECTRGKDKYRAIHVITMERLIGRRLEKNEVVHHKDGNKRNNAISNLVLMTRSEHARLHALMNYHNRRRDSYGRFL